MTDTPEDPFGWPEEGTQEESEAPEAPDDLDDGHGEPEAPAEEPEED